MHESGTGKFESSAGTLVFAKWGTKWSFPTFDGEINVSGSGTIKFEQTGQSTRPHGTVNVSGGTLINNDGGWFGSGTFNLSGGTLDVNQHLCFRGAFNYTGGTIDVAAGKNALFKKQ